MSISATTRGLRPGVCTSTTRPASPFDGQLIYETDSNLLRVWNGSAWKTLSYSDATNGTVLQVVSTTKTDTLSASLSGAATTDITGLTATITPTSTSSNVLVLVQTNGAISSNNWVFNEFRLMRGTTAIGIGESAGNRLRVTSGAHVNVNGDNDFITTTMIFLDSPSTTSATTYGVQIFNGATATRTVYVNRTAADPNTAGDGGIRPVSTITVMEVAA